LFGSLKSPHESTAYNPLLLCGEISEEFDTHWRVGKRIAVVGNEFASSWMWLAGILPGREKWKPGMRFQQAL
jgi:hypothetical protein